MPGKRVYGKARPRHQAAASIFGEASSSPIAPQNKSIDISRGADPTAVKECNKPVIKVEACSNGADVDSLVGHLGTLQLTGGNVLEGNVKISQHDKQQQSPSPVLAERKHNEIADSPRSVRAKRRLELRDSLLLSGLENLSIGDEAQTIPTPNKSISNGASSHEPINDPTPSKSSPPRRARRAKCTKPTPTQQHTAALNASDQDSIYTKHVEPLLQLSNAQIFPVPFHSWSDSAAPLFNFTKIAEASYGEVYRLSLRRDRSKGTTKIGTSEESVLKLIALKPPPNATKQSKSKTWKEKIAGMSDVTDVAGEVRLLRRMTPVPGFTNFRDVLVLQGPLPQPLVKAWRYFNEHVKESFFSDPGQKGAYPDDQLWALIEMQDAGKDLENTIIDSAHVVWDVFWGVAVAVAKGEEFAAFEHRDLHLGNVCVQQPAGKKCKVDTEKTLGFTGIETTIIDYTLSRARMDGSPSPPPTAQDGSDAEVAHFDLSKDPAIFSGDESEDYQYAIYRYMRSAVLHDDPLASVPPLKQASKGRKPSAKALKAMDRERDEWQRFHPRTNTVWLHFILFTLLQNLDLSRAAIPRSKAGRSIREHHDMLLDRLSWMSSTLMSVKALSRGAVVLGEEVKLKTAGELVTWAVAVGWLSEEDVVGYRSGAAEELSMLSLPQMDELRINE